MQETQVPQETPLQYSCLENSIDRGAWQATQSMGSQRVGMTEQLTLFSIFQTKKKLPEIGTYSERRNEALYQPITYCVIQ